uniref:cellulase n=1 Tax=Agrobacterium tumefaciens TaxID=358 RepID=Q44416_AGRTU|nr:endoglucanase [Agrobacterium tumefaciens]prf//2105261D celC gene [Agrobacterium tumefaciens]
MDTGDRADFKRELLDGMQAMTRENRWRDVTGRVAAYDAAAEKIETVEVERPNLYATRAFSLSNWRLIAANWLSSNVLSYSLAFIGFGVAARFCHLRNAAHDGAASMKSGISKIAGIVSLSAMMLFAGLSLSRAASIPTDAWAAYKGAFLDPGGRIIDTGNSNISHSEGQGYGMWLAVLADNLSDFELIWSFTRTELLVRDDGLSAWKWDPRTRPHVTDINNATDGDILIAYAVALAAGQWNRQDYAEASAAIASVILKKTVVQRGGRTLLLPAAKRFWRGRIGPMGRVVNPSYLIFEAFPVLNLVAPSPLWKAVADDGVAQIGAFAFSDRKLPADWVSVKTKPQPASGFQPEFGYNAVRIPLYLARANMGAPELLSRLKDGMTLESRCLPAPSI